MLSVAFVVKVTAKNSCMPKPFKIASMRRRIMTNVLPLPADAETMTLPLREIASCCSFVS